MNKDYATLTGLEDAEAKVKVDQHLVEALNVHHSHDTVTANES